MKNRIEIEYAENGYTVRCWKKEEDDSGSNEYGYMEPELYIAETDEELFKIIKEKL